MFVSSGFKEPYIEKTPGNAYEAISNFEEWEIKMEYYPGLYPEMKHARIDFSHPSKPLYGAESLKGNPSKSL